MRAPTETELREAYAGRRVLVTGHTGFKGSWLTLWLSKLGAKVTGLALPPTPHAMFRAARVDGVCQHVEGDVQKLGDVRGMVERTRPEIIFHLAAQALVRKSYAEPLETLMTNVAGTAHVLEAVRLGGRPCAVVVVSSDKCYENQEWLHGYREDDPMGGHDVYSMSKGATELVTSSWRRSFFPPHDLAKHGVAIASGRAGNVIGGGDWAVDRVIPDSIAALIAGRPIPVRNPASVRPWQHVLEPLGGYLVLGARLLGVGTRRIADFCEPFNFGPALDAARPVRDLVDAMVKTWGSGGWEDRSDPNAVHEATLLRLAIDKAHARLGWGPRWSFEETITRTVEWYRAEADGATPEELQALTLEQIAAYERAGRG